MLVRLKILPTSGPIKGNYMMSICKLSEPLSETGKIRSGLSAFFYFYAFYG